MFRLGGSGSPHAASAPCECAAEPGVGAVSSPSVPAAPPAAPGRGRVVLVVEDETFVRSIQCEVLRAAGFHVLAAGSAEVGLVAAAAFDGRIDVLVSDLTLPGLPGCELAARLIAQRPGIGVVFTSGYGDDWSPCDRFSGSLFLQKPFSVEGLVDAVGMVAGVPAREVPQRASAGLPADA